MMAERELRNRFGSERISDRQIDELIGIAKGIAADGTINDGEVGFLQKWLAANSDISSQPVIRTLYERVSDILSDGTVDEDEKADLLDTLNRFSDRDFELGEALKATTLPICNPAPDLKFYGKRYCFTGTFNFGDRKRCEGAVIERGGEAGSLTKATEVLVIGVYATDSWKHSTFGNKIIKAAEMRDRHRVPICLVSEQHWATFL
jgi:NAD-dependent DNA ligase